MAVSQERIDSISTTIANNLVELKLGDARATVPIHRLDALIRALEGIRHMVGGVAPSAPAAVESAPLPPVVPAESAAAPQAKPKKKRRSRKRVGDALIKWMNDNPGWHSEQELLEVVEREKMTDATPKRALKIALGKQHGTVFEDNGNGYWKLAADTTAGDPPESTGARGAARRAKGKTASKGTRARRLKARPKSGDDSAEPAPAMAPRADAPEDDFDDLAFEEETQLARTVLVKRGQDRKRASLPPGELEARQARAEAIERRRGRWERSPAELVERARKNLLGLGPAPAAATAAAANSAE